MSDFSSSGSSFDDDGVSVATYSSAGWCDMFPETHLCTETVQYFLRQQEEEELVPQQQLFNDVEDCEGGGRELQGCTSEGGTVGRSSQRATEGDDAAGEGTTEQQHQRKCQPLRFHCLNDLNFTTIHEVGTEVALRVDALLLLIFSFLEADMTTLLSVSHVSRSWRERADYLSQWRRVFIRQQPRNARLGFAHVNSRTSLIATKKTLLDRQETAASQRIESRLLPVTISRWTKLLLIMEFGAVNCGLTISAVWMGLYAGGLPNDVSAVCAYFFPALFGLVLFSFFLATGPEEDEDEDCCCGGAVGCLTLCFDRERVRNPFEAPRTRHLAKTLFVGTFLIALVMNCIVVLMGIRVRRLTEWVATHPSWTESPDPVLYSFPSHASNFTTAPSRFLPGAVVFDRPELFRWAPGDPLVVNISGAVLVVARMLEPVFSVPVGARAQRYAVAASSGENWSAMIWPPGASGGNSSSSGSSGPITMRTPLEAVGYFNLDAEIAAHLQWYHAWNTSVMGSPPPPLLVGMGPTPEHLLADYTNGLWIVLYTITALFGVCVVMVWLPLSATRCVWRCSLVVTLLVMNTIQMTVWGGVCYFRSASGAINQPPPYCLMSKSSAMGLFASGLIMTTLPFVVSFTDN